MNKKNLVWIVLVLLLVLSGFGFAFYKMSSGQSLVLNGLSFNLPTDVSLGSSVKKGQNILGPEKSVSLRTSKKPDVTLHVYGPLKTPSPMPTDKDLDFKSDTVKISKDGCGGGWCEAFIVQFNDGAQYQLMFEGDEAMSSSDMEFVFKSVKRME